MRVLANDIHDPHGHNNHLADGFAAQGLFYRIEGQNGSLNLGFASLPRNGDIGALLAVDLDRQSDGVFDQKLGLDLFNFRAKFVKEAKAVISAGGYSDEARDTLIDLLRGTVNECEELVSLLDS